MDKMLHELLAAIVAFVSAMVPAALGAAVSLAYETGLTWSRRFVQMSVGVCVSYFVTSAIGAAVTLSPFVQQAVGFVVGMIAFKSVPRFRDSAIDAVADLPGAIRDRFFPRKDQP